MARRSFAQRIHWKALPDEVRERLTAISHCRVGIHRAQGDPRVPLLAHRTRRMRVWVYAIVAAISLFLGIKAWFYELRVVDSPGFGEQGIVLFSLLAALTLVPFLLFLSYFFARRGSPFAPGLFLTATDLIDTRDPVLRVISMEDAHLVAIDHRINFAAHSHSSMNVMTPDGRRIEFPLLSRQEVADVRAAVDAFKRDPAARKAADAFAGIRRQDGTIDRPAPARIGLLRVVAPIVVGLAVAIPLGYVVAELRQRAHDQAAYAAATSRSERLDYAIWGTRGDEVRAQLGIRSRRSKAGQPQPSS